MGRINELLSLWKNLTSLLSRAAPLLSITLVVVTILEALAAIGVLYVIKILIDTITAELNAAENADLSRILFVLVATGGAALGATLLQSISAIVRMRQGL